MGIPSCPISPHWVQLYGWPGSSRLSKTLILSSLSSESMSASKLKVHSVGHHEVDNPKTEILPLKWDNLKLSNG